MKFPSYEINLVGRGTHKKIRSIVLQSPLAGISDQIFRKFVRRWAPDALLFTEMVNANSLELGHGRQKIEELAQESGPIGVQIFDYRPKEMAAAAKRAEDCGAFLIDINMGCPVKKIAKKGGGSGLLKDEKLAAKIIQEVSKSVSIPVTVKTRLGWNNDLLDPIGLALRLQDAGAQMITVHGRTREQGFSGHSDWTSIAKVKNALEIPVIANGDINNTEDAIRCLEITSADGIMIGRGSMGAPWLVGQISAELEGKKVIKSPNAKEKIRLSIEHLKSLLELKGDHGLFIARKHICWTCNGFEGALQLRNAFLKTTIPIEAIKILEEALKNY